MRASDGPAALGRSHRSRHGAGGRRVLYGESRNRSKPPSLLLRMAKRLLGRKGGRGFYVRARRRLQWIYASKGDEQLRERYDVGRRLRQRLDDLEWNAPQAGAERCSHFALPMERSSSRVRTGLVGVSLAARGHSASWLDCRMACCSAARAPRVLGAPQGSLLIDCVADGRSAPSFRGRFHARPCDGSAFAELARVTSLGGQYRSPSRRRRHDLGTASNNNAHRSGTWQLVDSPSLWL